MTRPSRTPGLLEPLSAALVGAGFFVFAAALLAQPLWRGLDARVWRALQPPLPDLGAVLVEGGTAPATAAGRARSLAADLLALRALSPTAIVLEDLLDEPSQAEGREVMERARAALAGLPRRQAAAALARLSGAASALDADESLERAIRACGNVILPFEATWASSRVDAGTLEAASRAARSGYQVLLKGTVRQRLPGAVVLRSPLPAFAGAAAGLCAVEAAADAEGPVHGVAELAGRWVNLAGFEAARRQLGVPVAALRYRWRSRVLHSVELKGVRLPLDDQARFLLQGQGPGLPRRGMAEVRSRAARLAGKVVFFRPWPQRQPSLPGWERQERLYLAIAGRDLGVAPEPWGMRLVYALSALALLVLAWGAPAWAYFGAWAGCAALLTWRSLADGLPLAYASALLAAALLCGLGLLIQRRRRRLAARDLGFAGVVSPSQREAWHQRLPQPLRGGVVEGSYVCVPGEPSELEGLLEGWLEASGAFHDRAAQGYGALVPTSGGRELAGHLAALRQALGKRSFAFACGPVSLDATERFGALAWRLSGQPKERALALAGLAKPGQALCAEGDYEKVRHAVRIQVTGGLVPDGGPGQAEKVLNVISFG